MSLTTVKATRLCRPGYKLP